MQVKPVTILYSRLEHLGFLPPFLTLQVFYFYFLKIKIVEFLYLIHWKGYKELNTVNAVAQYCTECWRNVRLKQVMVSEFGLLKLLDQC